MSEYLDLSTVIDTQPDIDDVWKCISDEQFVDEAVYRFNCIIEDIIDGIDDEQFDTFKKLINDKIGSDERFTWLSSRDKTV